VKLCVRVVYLANPAAKLSPGSFPLRHKSQGCHVKKNDLRLNLVIKAVSINERRLDKIKENLLKQVKQFEYSVFGLKMLFSSTSKTCRLIFVHTIISKKP